MTTGVSLEDGLRYLTWAIYVAVFFATLFAALRMPTVARWNTAVFFGAIAAVVVLSAIGQTAGADGGPPAAWAPWLARLTAALAMALPYLLLRLADHFSPVRPWVLWAAAAGMALAIAAVAAAPQPLPRAVTLALVAYFVAVAGYDAWSFARAAFATRGVTQRRTQAVALGTAGLGAAVLAAGLAPLSPEWQPWLTLTGRLCGVGSAIGFWLGCAPPSWLRRAWQEPQLRAMLERVARLTHASDLPAVVAELEEGVAAALGAPAAAIGLWDAQDEVLRFHHAAGHGPAAVRSTGGAEEAARACGLVMRGQVLDVPAGRLISGRAYREQRVILSENAPRDDPDHAPLYRALGVRAVLAAPITAGAARGAAADAARGEGGDAADGLRLGVLTIGSPRPPLFAGSDVELAQLLADQAAVVLESRRLLEETARARARAEADRLKDEFLASISHDLRNPLAAVQGVAQVLERRLERDGALPPDRLTAALRNITGATGQMAALIDQLLDYARLRFDRPLELDRRPTDLVALARRAAEQHAAASERHRVLLEAPDDTLVGQWDAARLERVLQNLLSNALKYSPEGGEVRVRVWREPVAASGAAGDPGPDADWAAISVSDEGVGIPQADLPRVFEPFGRAANVRGAIAGTGIGLAAARAIVEQHGGTIGVESEEGRGATFTVRLPLAPPRGDGRPPSDEAGGPSPVAPPAPARAEDDAAPPPAAPRAGRPAALPGGAA